MRVIKYKRLNAFNKSTKLLSSKLVLEDGTVVSVSHKKPLTNNVELLDVIMHPSCKTGWMVRTRKTPRSEFDGRKKPITAKQIFGRFEGFTYDQFEVYAGSHVMTHKEILKLHALIMDNYGFLRESKIYSLKWLEKILEG